MSKPEIPSQYKNLAEWCLDLARKDKNAREIRSITGCSKSYSYDATSKARKEKAKGKAEKTDIKIKTVELEREEKVEVPEEDEEEIDEDEIDETDLAEELKGEGVEVPAYVKGLLQGYFDEEMIIAIWGGVNELFPEKHQRPIKAIEFLGKVWTKPTNRYLAQYLEQNIDVYIAIAFTVITFAPSVIGIVRERRGKKTKGGEKK